MDSTDKVWNFIPLGVTIRKNKEVPVGWYLNDQNYVEGAYDTLPSTSILIAGGTGSGKSVVEANIIAHINEFKSNFQLIGADCKRIEFNAIRNKFDGVLETPKDTADAVSVVHKVMMERFKLLEKYKANSIYALISNTIKVPYYTIKGLGKYQFDTIFTGVHTTKKSRTSNGVTMTIEDIYNGLTEGLFDRARFESIVITSENIEKVEGFYMPKDIVFMVDEMSNLMLIDDDYKTVDTIKNTMGSIARLGRAVGIHLVLCCQRASGSVIWSDLKNNCQMNILLGGFDKDASILTLNEDLSDYCRPDIRGRGFIGSGNDIIETQIYSGRITRF